jgi:hypothetical protein
MSTLPRIQRQLVNMTDHPVELHLVAGVAIVAPRVEVLCSDGDLALGHVQALLISGVLAERASAVSEPEAADDAATKAVPPRRRSSGRSTKTRKSAEGAADA